MKHINVTTYLSLPPSIEYSNCDDGLISSHLSRSRSSSRFRSFSGALRCVAPHSDTSHLVVSRRRGQALLISVLLMVFASVLAATFVTVVALNLSQTARSGSVASARQAARAGLSFVNDQLTNSEQGERWNETDAQSAPTAAQKTYYYTDFERAQGWDQQKYIKFPDPRSATATASGSSIFLAKVTPISDSTTAASLGLTDDYIGQLKIDVIGRATDNDAAYSKLTFFKPTTANGNITSFARYVSNWNFSTKTANVSALRSAATAGTNTLVTGMEFSNVLPGRVLVVDDGTAAVVFVRSVSVNPTLRQVTLTLRDNLVSTVAQGTKIRAAAAFMGALDELDAVKDSTAPYEATDIPLQTGRGGIKANAAAFFAGKTQFELVTATLGQKPDVFEVSGPVANAGTAQVKSGTTTEDILSATTLSDYVRFALSGAPDPTDRRTSPTDLTPARIDTPNSRWLDATKNADISGGSQYGYGEGGVYIDNAGDVEKIAQYRRNPNYSIPGDPAVLTTYRKMNLSEQQRFLQRKSFAAVDAGTYDDPSTAPIETNPVEPGNAGDTKAGPGPYGIDAGNSFHRLAFQRPADSYAFPVGGIASLEQRGIRGWVSDKEFLPRGAFVDLRGTDIIITRDDRNDNGDVDPEKAWKDTTGANVSTGANTFRMVINTTNGQRRVGAPGAEVNVGVAPANGFKGVIYAEGNLRIRGSYTGTKDLTIVSMGNIYIEGSIKRGTRHIALLAKQNVIMNPTQFLARVEGSQDSDLAGNLNNTITGANELTLTDNLAIPVANTQVRVGDRVRVSGENSWRLVTAIDATSTRLTVSGPLLTLNSTARPLDRLGASRQGVSTTINNDNIFARTVRMDGVAPSGNYALSTRNRAALSGRLFNLQRQGTAPSPPATAPPFQVADGIYRIKNNTDGDPYIVDSEKTLEIDDSPAASYSLLDANGNGTNDGDAVENVSGLSRQFHIDETGRTEAFRDLANTPSPAYPNEEVDLNNNWEINGASSPNMATAVRRLLIASGTQAPNATSNDLYFATSIGVFWRQDLSLFGANAAPDFTIGSSFNTTGLAATTSSGLAYNTRELVATVSRNFYGGGFNWITYPMPIAPNLSTPDVFALRRDLSAPASGSNSLPSLDVEAIKLDRDTLADVQSDPIDIEIEATIYAQNGSWFMMAMPRMYGNNPAAALVNDAMRYRRLNYQIKVVGNIAENFTPTAFSDYDVNQTPDEDAPTVGPPAVFGAGAQAQWLDASAYPTTATGTAWQTVNYIAPPALPPDHELMLPVTPDITLQR